MKLWRKIVVGFAVVAAICAYFFLRPNDRAQRAVEETRRLLRQQGFKTDLSEFNFSTSAELRARAAALTFVGPYVHRPLLPEGNPELMATLGTNAARVMWQQARWTSQSGEDFWPAMRKSFDESRAELDAACEAALAGPIRFDLNASAGSAMLLPHLAALKTLCQSLTLRAVLELHEGNTNAAWTNLLATSRLVTAYDPESAEVSHLVRFACMTIAYNAIWQALQADGWADDQLARLQHEWESVDFFKGLPETAAFTRASMVATCQLERQQPMSPGPMLKDMLRSPRYAWYGPREYLRELRYRHHGTYEDEKALLLYYRDRELQLRRALQAPTWSEMRQLPGVTNLAAFQSRYYSRMQAMVNSKQVSVGFMRQGQGLLGRPAESEARRRLIITALALERFRGRHGSYPKTLEELSPEFVNNPPTDFMDGQPLRYRVMKDGHFVLYSVGLDCADNGGTLNRGEEQRFAYSRSDEVAQPTDLVWPRPASIAEIKIREEEKEEEKQAVLKRETVEEERAETLRRAAVENLLAMKPARRAKGPTYQGQPLNKVLQNEKASGKMQLTLDELLTVKQIATGEDPDIATFEVPVSYDVVTNIGVLHLLVDRGPEPTNDVLVAASPEGRAYFGGGELQECIRATNGNCLLVWNTTYDPPGQHALQAQLLCTEKKNTRTFEVKGPVAPFFSSNLCQFDPFYSQFDSKKAILYAKLPESNGIYSIELKSPTGEHIKTLSGSTSNGVIKVHWDLIDDHGRHYTNNSFDSVFNVTLPKSGRSQTMKGQ